MITYYPKIETLFHRHSDTFKVIESQFKDEVYDLIKVWEFTEKIDGTNILINYDPESATMAIGGRTASSQLPGGVVGYINSIVTYDDLTAVFGDKPVTIYGEGYGYGIQSGGDYVSGEKLQRFIAFDVKVGHMWLAYKDVVDVCNQLNIPVVPFIGEMTLAEATAKVKAGFKSLIGNRLKDAEGLIGRTRIPLKDNLGRRLILKLKSCDF